MTDNKNSALSVLLITIIVVMIGVLAFRLHTRQTNTTEVKTTAVISGSNVVEEVIREFEAKPTSTERDIEVTGKFRTGMETGPRKSDMFNNMSAQPTTQLGE